MAKLAARKASLYLEDGAGASMVMSAMVSSITLSMSVEIPEVTGFGNDNRERVSNGIKDWELQMNGFYGTAASEPGTVLNSIYAAGGSTRFILGPAGSVSGCPRYSACGVLTTYEITEAPADAAAVSFTITARSGSITRGTF
jgi:hypothetical protein